MAERQTILDGTTATGRTVRVEVGDHYADARIVIDGAEATLTERPRLYRDGGTTEYRTDRGTVRFPRRIGDPDRTPHLDGERIAGGPIRG